MGLALSCFLRCLQRSLWSTVRAGRHSSDWAVCHEVELEDRNFWKDQWADTKSQLQRLQKAANTFHPRLQSVIAAKSTAKPEFLFQAYEANNTAKVLQLSSGGDNPMSRLVEKGKDLAAKLDTAWRETENSATDLVPELGLLKGLYADSKKKIGLLNAREASSKAKFAEHEADNTAR